MDPADSQQMRHALTAQGTTIGRHEQQLGGITETLLVFAEQQRAIQASLAEQTTALQALQGHQPRPPAPVDSLPPSPPQASSGSLSPVGETPLAAPERYSGDAQGCRGFLISCSLLFELQSSRFPTDRSRVAYVISLLSGRARDWAIAEWERGSSCCATFQAFGAEMRKVFDHTSSTHDTARRLYHLRQGRRRVSDYSIQFRTLATESGWNQVALYEAFYAGLAENIKDQLIATELPPDLDALITLAIRVDQRLAERARERCPGPPPLRPIPPPPPRHQPSGSSPSSTTLPVRFSMPLEAESSDPEPMQLGRAHLTPQEWQRRRVTGSCLYCGQLGHIRVSCPVRPKDEAHQW